MRNVLKGTTVAVTAAVITASMSLTNPMVVEAKTNPVGTVNIDNQASIINVLGKSSTTAKYTSDDVVFVGYDGCDMTPHATSDDDDETVATGTFNLNGIWTYVDNSANNPSPVLIEQENNTWVLTMYQGTTLVLGTTQTATATPISVPTGAVATACNEQGIVIAGVNTGIDVIAYQVPGITTTVTLAINVVPAAPGTGNGLVTNDTLVGVTTGNTTSTSTTSQSDSAKVQEMLKLINNARAKLGRGPLTINSELQAIAERRAVEIYSDFRHNGTGIINSMTISNSECITKGNSSGNGSGINASAALSNFISSKPHWNLISADDNTIVGIGFYKNCCVVLPGAYTSEEDLEMMDDWDW